MYRLSLKLFLVLAFVAGPVLGFAPDASAHKNTISTGVVVGSVGWPAIPKAGAVTALAAGIDPGNVTCLSPADCPGAGFNLFDRASPNDFGVGLSLDERDTDANPDPALNGCRLPLGNSNWGLPNANALNPANPGGLGEGRNYDLCFAFTKLLIESAGLWDGFTQQTNFVCVSSGVTGASGNMIDTDPITGGPLAGPVVGLGAFYGEFTCDPDIADPGDAPIGSADGHFHGLSQQGTIAFLGEVHCTQDSPVIPEADCHDTTDKTPGVGKPVNVSAIKHTLACKGNVTPENSIVTKPKPESGPGLQRFAKIPVRLECVIA